MKYKNIPEDLILKHETIESFPLKDDEKIFIAGYINAIALTEDWRGIAERAGYDLDSGLDGFIAPDFIRKAICDCLGFISAAPARIWLDGSTNHWHDPEFTREVASLFWYTRNGMGSGFFDSDSKEKFGEWAAMLCCGISEIFGEESPFFNYLVSIPDEDLEPQYEKFFDPNKHTTDEIDQVIVKLKPRGE